MALKISDEARVQMPMKTVASPSSRWSRSGRGLFLAFKKNLNTHAFYKVTNYGEGSGNEF